MPTTTEKPRGGVRTYDATREVCMAFWANDKNELTLWISKTGYSPSIRIDLNLRTKRFDMIAFEDKSIRKERE